MMSSGARVAPAISPAPLPMFRDFKTLLVELNTPTGSVFAGPAEGGSYGRRYWHQPSEESYLNLTRTTRITLRVGTEFLTLCSPMPLQAYVSAFLPYLREGIRPMTSEPVLTVPTAELTA